MKHLLLLLVILSAINFTVAAQDITTPQTTAGVAYDAVQKGNWLVGATLGSIGQNFRSDRFSIDIRPRAGIFISDNAAIGTQVQLGVDLYKGGQNFFYGLTPFARYYFPEGAAPTHRWFGELTAGIAGSSREDDEEDAVFSSVFGISAGYAHFVASNVALEGTLNLVRSHADVSVGSSGTTGLSLGLGFQIYLPSRANR
jgi:hypothetical protein